MNKLISMTDFVLQVVNEDRPCNRGKMLDEIGLYAEFLKQPLKLEMFVPCDDEGNVLEQPIYTTNHSDECYCKRCEEETKRCSDLQDQYKKAKEKVLFDGFTYNSEDESFERIEIDGVLWSIDIDDLIKYTIEDMVQCDLKLTQNATKQFL